MSCCDPFAGLAEHIMAHEAIGTVAKCGRGTALPSPVPTRCEFFSLDRQGSSLGDILYVSMQKSDASWAWVRIVGAS